MVKFRYNEKLSNLCAFFTSSHYFKVACLAAFIALFSRYFHIVGLFCQLALGFI